MNRELPLAATPDRPEVVLSIDGEEVGREVAATVLSVDVYEAVCQHSRASLLLDNWDPGQGAVRWSDEDLFVPGVAIEVRAGYRDELAPIFSGVVTALQAHFPEGAGPTMEVSCRSHTALLDAAPRSRVFEEATLGDVVATVAGEHGLTSDAVDGTSAQAEVQFQETDWRFLRRRARSLGLVIGSDGEQLVLAEPAKPETDVELLWGSTLLSFDVTQAIGRQTAAVEARAWDPETLEPAEASGTSDDFDVAADGRPAVADSLGDLDRTRFLAHPGEVPVDELRGLVAGEAYHQGLRHRRGAGTCVGIPAIRAGTWLRLAGVGERFSGLYHVGAVRHMITAGGYRTEFHLGPPPRLLDEPEPEPPGLAYGTVVDLADPRGWGRVKVSLPWLEGEPFEVWARLATPAAGDGAGFQFIPDVDTEVVVAFVGDARYPVVVGALWNGQQAPPEEVDPDANAVRVIVSRSGHTVTLDDTDGAALVEVVTAAGQSLLLDDGNTAVELKDGNGNTVKLSSDGIVLQSAKDISLAASSGKVLLDGIGIEGTSSGPSKLESSATLDLTASAVLGITGSLVKINS